MEKESVTGEIVMLKMTVNQIILSADPLWGGAGCGSINNSIIFSCLQWKLL